MNTIISVSATLIGLFLILTIKNSSGQGGGQPFKQITDSSMGVFTKLVATLQGR